MDLAVVILACQDSKHGYGMGLQISEPLNILQTLQGRSLIQWTLDITLNLNVKKIIVAPSRRIAAIGSLANSSGVVVVEQENECTGAGCDAACLLTAMRVLSNFHGNVLVVPPNFPLLRQDSIERFLSQHMQRRKLDDHHVATYLVEDRKKVLPIPVADRCVVCLDWNNFQPLLSSYLALPNPAPWWYYLRQNAHSVDFDNIRNPVELTEVNSFKSLSVAEKVLQSQNNEMHMDNGVYLVDPETIYIETGVSIGKSVTILPQTHLKAGTRIARGCTIGPNTIIDNSSIGQCSKVQFSVISDSFVGDDSTIGPYAHLRNHSDVGNDCRLGNFVELKATTVGNNTNVAHLSYLGDTTCGQRVNIGAGTIVANYDGRDKHKTCIGDDAKTGANSVLVAPLCIGSDVTVAAGSVIVKDVDDGCLVVARAEASVKHDWKPVWARA
eukprot:CFRG0537T1